MIEADHLRGVHEIKPQVGRQEDAVEVFAPAGGVIPGGAGKQVLFDLSKFAVQVDIDLQLPGDLLVPGADALQQVTEEIYLASGTMRGSAMQKPGTSVQFS